MAEIIINTADAVAHLKDLSKALSSVNRNVATFANNLQTKLIDPLNTASSTLQNTASSIKVAVGGIRSVIDTTNSLFSQLRIGDKAAVGMAGQLRAIVKQFNAIGKLDKGNHFSKLATSFSNLGKGLTYLKALQGSIGDANKIVPQLASFVNQFKTIGGSDSNQSSSVGFSQDSVKLFSTIADGASKINSSFNNLKNTVKNLPTKAQIDSAVVKLIDIVTKVGDKGLSKQTPNADNTKTIKTFLDQHFKGFRDVLSALGRLNSIMVTMTNQSATISSSATQVQNSLGELILQLGAWGAFESKEVTKKDGSTGTVKQYLDSSFNGFREVLSALGRLNSVMTTMTNQSATISSSATQVQNSLGELILQLGAWGAFESKEVTKKDGSTGTVKQYLDSSFNGFLSVVSSLNHLNTVVTNINTQAPNIKASVKSVYQNLSLIIQEMGSYNVNVSSSSDDKLKQQLQNKKVLFQSFNQIIKSLQSFNRVISSMNKSGGNSASIGFLADNISLFIKHLGEIARTPAFQAFQRLANAMQKVSNASKNLITASQKTTTAFNKMDQSSNKALFSLNKLHPVIRQFFTAMFGYNVVYSFARSLQGAVKIMASLELAMARVNTIARASQQLLHSWTLKVLQLASAYGKSQKDIAQALYHINSATIVGSNALYVLQASVKAALAGFTDVTKVAQLLSKVINAYGYSAKDAERLSDILFKTVERGINTMQQLSQYMGRVITVAGNAGVSFEQVSASIATMTSRGLQTNIAVTALNSAILKLSQGSKNLNKVFEQAGYASSAEALRIDGLHGAMRVLMDSTRGNTEALTKLGFNYRDIRAVSILASSSFYELSNNLKNVQNSAGATDKALEAVKQTLSYKWESFKNSLAQVIVLFQEWANTASVLKTVIDVLKQIVEFFKRILTGTTNTTDQIILFTAKFWLFTKVLPVITAGFMKIVSAAKQAAQSIKEVAQAQAQVQAQAQQIAPNLTVTSSGSTATSSGSTVTSRGSWGFTQMDRARAGIDRFKSLRQQTKDISADAYLKALRKAKQEQEKLNKTSKGFFSGLKNGWSKIGNAAKSFGKVLTGLFRMLSGFIKQFALFAAIEMTLNAISYFKNKNLDKQYESVSIDTSSIKRGSESDTAALAAINALSSKKHVTLDDTRSASSAIDAYKSKVSELSAKIKQVRQDGGIVSGSTLRQYDKAIARLDQYQRALSKIKKTMSQMTSQQRLQMRAQSFFSSIAQRAKNTKKSDPLLEGVLLQRRKAQLQKKYSSDVFDISQMQQNPQYFAQMATEATMAGVSFTQLTSVSNQYLAILQKLKQSSTQLDSRQRQAFSFVSKKANATDLYKSFKDLFNFDIGMDVGSLRTVDGRPMSFNMRSMESIDAADRLFSSRNRAMQSLYMHNITEQAGRAYKREFDTYSDMLPTMHVEALRTKQQIQRDRGGAVRFIAALNPVGGGRANQEALRAQQDALYRGALQQKARAAELQRRFKSHTTRGNGNTSVYVQQQFAKRIQALEAGTDQAVKKVIKQAKEFAGITDFQKASIEQMHRFSTIFTQRLNEVANAQVDEAFQRQIRKNLEAVQTAYIKGGLEKASKQYDRVFGLSALQGKSHWNDDLQDSYEAQKNRALGAIMLSIHSFGNNFEQITKDISAGMSKAEIIGKYGKNLSGESLKKLIEAVDKGIESRQNWFKVVSETLQNYQNIFDQVHKLTVLSKKQIDDLRRRREQIQGQMYTVGQGANKRQISHRQYQEQIARRRREDPLKSIPQIIQQMQSQSGWRMSDQHLSKFTDAASFLTKIYALLKKQDDGKKQDSDKIPIPDSVSAQRAMTMGSSQFINMVMEQTGKTPEQRSLESIDNSAKKIQKGVRVLCNSTTGAVTFVPAVMF